MPELEKNEAAMPPLKLLLVQPAHDHAQSLAGLDRLAAIELAGATKIIVTHEKLDTQKKAKTYNVHADYSAVPPALVTLSHRAGRKPLEDPAYAVGFDLWTLSNVAAKFAEGRDWAVLLGKGEFDADALPNDDAPFRKIGDHLAINLSHDDALDVLALTVEMVGDGAAYLLGGDAMALLGAAQEAHRLMGGSGQ